MEKNSSATQPAKPSPSKESTTEETLGVVGAILAGGASMYAHILYSFTVRMRKGVLRNLYETKVNDLENLGLKLHEPNLSDVEAKNIKDAIWERRGKFDADWNRALKKMGAEGTSLKGIAYRFKDIDTSDKFKSAALGLTIFSVAMGAIINIHQRRTLSERIGRLEESKQQASPAQTQL